MVTAHSQIQTGLSAAERVFAIFDIEAENIDQDKTIEFTEKIECEYIQFSYPGYKDVVLNDVSFSINKGDIVALVGSSGSGKSTILDLIPRFYNLTSGSIKIDNTDINDMPLFSLRSLFGVVSQDTILFDDTVLNNIAYGQENPDVSRVEDALKAANATDFTENLPDGLNTIIGERGVTLSGGQKQRLAIARALYKNPEVLILDEATSALDTESEKIVQEAIDNLIENRTSIVVAHRLSTIKSANQILVLDKGKIVERGNHEELLSLGGRYRTLYDIQFGSKSEGN